MANNSHGNKNEIEIANYLNNKKYKNLNLTMKEFIKYICKTKNISFNDETLIYAKDEKNKKLKEDIYITINNTTINVSLKMGTGNSLHQEKIEDFINYIKQNSNATNEVCNSWRLFIWADGTIDGSGSLEKDENGKIISRFGASGFKQKYPRQRILLQNFINENKALLLDRVLFNGNHNSSIDFVYHGTYKQGRWISKKEILEYLIKFSSKKNCCLSLSNLTIQAWNISSKGKTEKKRGQIQFKYASMKNDFDLLMKSNADIIGTFIGNLEEFDLSQSLNKNKKNPMWKILLPDITDFSDYFLIKVSSNQKSSLCNKKVKTKSDAYVIKASLSKEFLLSKEYILEESDLVDINYKVQDNTGISIKLKESKNYTYQKFTKETFCKAFNHIEDIEFWLTALLIYNTEDDIEKNKTIINAMGFSLEEFLHKVAILMKIPTININKDFWESIRKCAQEKIKNEILSNKRLAENIFLGKHWFESPYHANFIFENGHLKENKISKFTITTGSGRSKGKYNIAIKK